MKFTRDLIIRFEHCDAAGLIFYPRFFGLVNETVEDWFAGLGHSFKSLHRLERICCSAVRRCQAASWVLRFAKTSGALYRPARFRRSTARQCV